jgi:hypothetical protein
VAELHSEPRSKSPRGGRKAPGVDLSEVKRGVSNSSMAEELSIRRADTARVDTNIFNDGMQRCPNDKKCSPELWGITRTQLKDILREILLEPEMTDWNVYTFVNEWVKPRTSGKGMGYALLLNQDAPKTVNVMVSHAWCENAIEFLKTVVRSSSKHDVFFICALSLYQNEDGKGPSIEQQIGKTEEENPFKIVLKHIKTKGSESWLNYITHQHLEYIEAVPQLFTLLALMLFYASGWTKAACMSSLRYCYLKEQNSMGVWSDVNPWQARPLPQEYKNSVYCAQLFAMIALVSFLFIKLVLMRNRAGYRGRMIVVPNSNDDIYGRLWCVYEIFVASHANIPVRLAKTLATLGKSTSEDAQCSNPGDKERILKNMKDEWGDQVFQKVDTHIKRIARASLLECIYIVLRWGFVIILLGIGRFNVVRAADGCDVNEAGVATGIIATTSGVMAVLWKTADDVDGVVTVRRCLTISASFFIAAIVANSVWWLMWIALWTDGDGAWNCDVSSTEMFVEGFLHVCFPGLYSAAVLVLLFTVYSYTQPDRYSIKLKEVSLVALLFVLYLFVCTPVQQWKDWDMAWPEAMFTLLSASALFLCPLFALWIFSIHWGIAVSTRHKDEARFQSLKETC